MPDLTFATYQAYAHVYNELNHRNDYEMWVGRVLLPELEKHGLRKGRVLDVACGTGRAFDPLLRRGWEVHGCDLSPAMLEIAEREVAGRVPLSVADMRDLPLLGKFELVLVLNDSIDYLLGDDELARALLGLRSNLADDGLLLFDCNSRLRYETSLTSEMSEVEHGGRRWTWRGLGPVADMPDVFEARIEGSDIEPVTHRQRFRAEGEMRRALGDVGLECLSALGMEEIDERVVLSPSVDESRHYKIVYVAAAR